MLILNWEMNPLTMGERALRFQPRDLVPAIGGHMLYSNGQDGPQKQNYLLDRTDVLLWSTAELDQELIVVGPILLRLYLEMSLRTFDISAKLIDLFPDGTMRLVTDGYRRFKQAISHPTS